MLPTSSIFSSSDEGIHNDSNKTNLNTYGSWIFFLFFISMGLGYTEKFARPIYSLYINILHLHNKNNNRNNSVYITDNL